AADGSGRTGRGHRREPTSGASSTCRRRPRSPPTYRSRGPRHSTSASDVPSGHDSNLDVSSAHRSAVLCHPTAPAEHEFSGHSAAGPQLRRGLDMPDRTVTVIGLGPMGRATALTLIDAGHEVTVWNRTPVPGRRYRRRGAIPADTSTAAIAANGLVLGLAHPP